MYLNFNKYFNNLLSFLRYLKWSFSLQRYWIITEKISENGKKYMLKYN